MISLRLFFSLLYLCTALQACSTTHDKSQLDKSALQISKVLFGQSYNPIESKFVDRHQVKTWIAKNRIDVSRLPQEVKITLAKDRLEALFIPAVAPDSRDGRWNRNKLYDVIYLPIDCRRVTFIEGKCQFEGYLIQEAYGGIGDDCILKKICACNNGKCECAEWCGAANPDCGSCKTTGKQFGKSECVHPAFVANQ